MQDNNEQEQVESRGPTVDEAISEALLMLGARRNEVDIEVIEEPKTGLFGVFGKRQARVLATRRKKRSRGRRGGRRRRGGQGQGAERQGRETQEARRDDKPQGRSEDRSRDRNRNQPRGRSGERSSGRNEDRSRRRSEEAPKGRRDEAPRGRRDQRQSQPRSEQARDRRPEPARADTQDALPGNERLPRRRPPRRRSDSGSRSSSEQDMRSAAEMDKMTRSQSRGEPKPMSDSRPPREPRRDPEPRETRPVARVESVESVPDGQLIAAAEVVAPTRGLAESDAAEVQRGLAEELMQRSGFACRSTVIEGDYNQVKIIADTDSAAVLIGRHGSTVDAVEHLVDRMANQAIGEHVRMNLDINNYRHRREGQLTENALDAVRQVQASGEDLHTPPLCARERRIVHLAVEKVDGVTTHTSGFGPDRHVVVTLEGQSDEGDVPTGDTPIETAPIETTPIVEQPEPPVDEADEPDAPDDSTEETV